MLYPLSATRYPGGFLKGILFALIPAACLLHISAGKNRLYVFIEYQGANVKKILLLPLLALLMLAGCSSMEEERNAVFNNALSLEESGKYAEAKDTARKALELDPNFSLAYLLLGRCDMEQKDMGSALANFSQAHRLAPDNLEALENLSRISLLQNNLAQAEEYANKAQALSPASSEVKIIRAGIFMRKEDYAQAKPLLEDVLKSEPNNEEALVGLATIAINSGEVDKAKELLRGAISGQARPSVAILSLLTNLSLQENDVASAEMYLKQLMKVDTANEQVLLQLANLYLATGKQQEMSQALTGYLEKHPDSLLVRSRLAELHLAQGNVDEALSVLDKAPDSPAVRLMRASVLTQAGKVDEAIPALQALVGDSKTDKETLASARIGLANIYMQQNMPGKAEEELSGLLLNDPQNAQALFLRGGLYFNERRFDKALEDLEKVIQLEPNDPAAHLGLADVYNASGNPLQAEVIISDVIARFPQYSQAYITLANLNLVQKKPEAALMTLNIGKNTVKDNAEIILAECDILASLKRYDEARSLMEGLSKNDSYEIMALLRMAEVDMVQSKFGAAAKTYERILEKHPNTQAAVEGNVQALIAGKKTKEALAFAEKRQKDNPEDPMSAYLVAETALVNKEAAKAEKGFLRALELEPRWEQPLTRLAQLYTSSGRINDAIKLADTLIEKQPDNVSPAVLKGILLEQKGELGNAEAQYRKTLAQHADNLLASNNLAYLLARYKSNPERLKEAEEMARKATASGAPATFDTLGWIQHLQGNNVEAEPNVRRAYESIQNNPTITYHLAAILASFGDKEKNKEAVTLLEQVATQDIEFAQVEEAKKLLQTLQPAKQPAPARRPQQGNTPQQRSGAQQQQRR